MKSCTGIYTMPTWHNLLGCNLPRPRLRMKEHLRRETGQKSKNPPKVSFDVVCARIDEKAFTFFLLFFLAFCLTYFVVCLC